MSDLVPGELLTADEPVEINAGRETETVTVENTGD
ncbi:urease subunit beta, partial [Halorubrum sp. CBA1125]|nr:urease subunit beta [Halorubrum sp. CBA1125]